MGGKHWRADQYTKAELDRYIECCGLDDVDEKILHLAHKKKTITAISEKTSLSVSGVNYRIREIRDKMARLDKQVTSKLPPS